MPQGPLIVYTDGSAIDNGTRHCRAGIGCYWPALKHLNVFAPCKETEYTPTNNRAEYRAMLQACKTADEVDPGFTKQLHVFTDSKLLVRTWNDPAYMKRWQRKGWRLTDGGPVKNLDLVKQLWQLKQGQRSIKVTWVPRHKNEKADQLAKKGSKAAQKAGNSKRY